MPTADRPRETLSRAQRIRSTGDFFRLKENGKRQVHGCLVMNWQPAPSNVSDLPFQTRLGVVTSKRVGGAVIRNRARRLIREVFRKNRHLIQPIPSVVLVARPSISGMGYSQVERDFVEILRRARLMRNSPPSSQLSQPPTSRLIS